MRGINSLPLGIFVVTFVTANFFCQNNSEKTKMQISKSDVIQLPPPEYKSSISIEEAILKRRSVREYKNEPLSLADVSQILWSAQGITDKPDELRTAPSAGALYPLEIYLIASNVKELSEGIYKYDPFKHTINKIIGGDKRLEISNAALRQNAIESSSAMIVITAIYERTSVKYGKRAERYVHMEVGHVGQNIYLQTISLRLGTVMMGAFKDESLKKVLNLPANEFPLAIYPLGRI